MSKNLLVLTTGGYAHFLYDAVKTLQDPLDVLVVDDGTPVKGELAKFCKEKKIHFITKEKPRGLTHSWNLAYQFFMSNGYNACILSNDDVRFQKGFSTDLLRGLKKYDITCPVSNKPGTRNCAMWKKQFLNRHCKLSPGKDKANREKIQRFLKTRFGKSPYLPVGGFNGFCFAFSRKIKRFCHSENHLFNKGLRNIKNEIDLVKRMRKRKGKIAICLTSYVYHFKNATFGGLGIKNKDRLWTSSNRLMCISCRYFRQSKKHDFAVCKNPKSSTLEKKVRRDGRLLACSLFLKKEKK